MKQSIVKGLVVVSLRIVGWQSIMMNYDGMDILDEVREIKILLDKFPNLNEEETEQLRVLSNNISVDIAGMQYDMKVEEQLEREWQLQNR